ncbi:MAG TPA: adenylyl-sulfate kinase, partial [Propionibacteriaceae bacterium]
MINEPRSSAGQVAQGKRREQDAPLSVLFVCTANICRSPFMELLARHLAGPDSLVEFFSAGIHGFVDRPMDDIMATTLLPRGIVGAGSFRSRPLTGELIERADLVLTAETAHRSFILDEHPASFRTVFTLGQFVNATRGVAPTLHGRPLLAEVGQHRGLADPT